MAVVRSSHAEPLPQEDDQTEVSADDPSPATPDDVKADDRRQADADTSYTSQTIRGRVVWLAEALKDDFGISTVPEARKRILALRSLQAELYPIVENSRGRAFRKDERLREMDVELLVRTYNSQPMVQILKVFECRGDEKYEVDYWCDICAIAMYETGPCSCCQGENRLRKRKVAEDE
jgi:hypothetical protein